MNTVPQLHADYDLVGQYAQDSINGFEEELVRRMFELGKISEASSVLDAMAGDGNLSEKLLHFCDNRKIKVPSISMLEYSKVQCEIAAQRRALNACKVIWGDMISLTERASGVPLETRMYDRVFIKSANHELPPHDQGILYKNVFSLLQSGGLFINLGFLFEDEEERDEFREITYVKDSLAGLNAMAERRHFPTRDELYEQLSDAGFTGPIRSYPITYTLRSWVAAEQYFTESERVEKELLLHASQAKARKLRKNGKILFHGDRTTMYMPGEITVVEKPKNLDERPYETYPYDFLRNIKVHRELLAKISSIIGDRAVVADLGCGLGLLLEKIKEKVGSYIGIDSSRDFIRECSYRFRDQSNVSFMEGDLNEVQLSPKAYDAVVLSNVLYQSTIDPVHVLRKCIGAVRPGGLICVSGPTSPSSFSDTEEMMREDLLKEGHLPTHQELFNNIVKSNERLLTARGHYWSAEGMVSLLLSLGCKDIQIVDTTIYYGSGYFIVAKI